MSFKLPLLDRLVPVTSEKGYPSLVFHKWWQNVVRALEAAISDIQNSVTDIQAALDAADIALAAADTAQSAADSAQSSAAAVGEVALLSSSGVSGMTLTATDVGASVSITVSSHDRVYTNGTTVSVDSGSLTSLSYNTVYFIYYDDPTYSGGAVSYSETEIEATAAQTGARHLVGVVQTPAALDPDVLGDFPKIPGLNLISEYYGY